MNSEDDVVLRLCQWMGILWKADRSEQRRGQGINPGWPDLMYSCAGRRGLIEAKFIPTLPESIELRLRRQQAEFLMRHGKECRFAYVALGIGEPDMLRLYPYSQIPLLQTRLKRDVLLGLGRGFDSARELQMFLSGRADGAVRQVKAI